MKEGWKSLERGGACRQRQQKQESDFAGGDPSGEEPHKQKRERRKAKERGGTLATSTLIFLERTHTHIYI